MAAWIYALGGLVVWTAHFFGVYAIASIADVASRADDPRWLAGGLAFSAACALAAAVLAASAWRAGRGEADPTCRFMHQLGALGAAIAGVAILWQALPTVIV